MSNSILTLIHNGKNLIGKLAHQDHTMADARKLANVFRNNPEIKHLNTAINRNIGQLRPSRPNQTIARLLKTSTIQHPNRIRLMNLSQETSDAYISTWAKHIKNTSHPNPLNAAYDALQALPPYYKTWGHETTNAIPLHTIGHLYNTQSKQPVFNAQQLAILKIVDKNFTTQPHWRLMPDDRLGWRLSISHPDPHSVANTQFKELIQRFGQKNAETLLTVFTLGDKQGNHGMAGVLNHVQQHNQAISKGLQQGTPFGAVTTQDFFRIFSGLHNHSLNTSASKIPNTESHSLLDHIAHYSHSHFTGFTTKGETLASYPFRSNAGTLSITSRRLADSITHKGLTPEQLSEEPVFLNIIANARKSQQLAASHTDQEDKFNYHAMVDGGYRKLALMVRESSVHQGEIIPKTTSEELLQDDLTKSFMPIYTLIRNAGYRAHQQEVTKLQQALANMQPTDLDYQRTVTELKWAQRLLVLAPKPR